MKLGVYFDIRVSNTTSLYLHLHNAPNDPKKKSPNPISSAPANQGRLSFRPLSTKAKPAPPLSLVAVVDGEEYIVLRNSSGLVAVSADGLDPSSSYNVRIIAPGLDDDGIGIIELEGILLSKGGRLEPIYKDRMRHDIKEYGRPMEDDRIWEAHNPQHSKSDRQSNGFEKWMPLGSSRRPHRNKLLEVVTDYSGLLRGLSLNRQNSGHPAVLSSLSAWYNVIGELFHADHVTLSLNGVCMTKECVEGEQHLASIGDTFFRRSEILVVMVLAAAENVYSGPVNTSYFQRPWNFRSYVPDAVVWSILPLCLPT